MLDINKHEDNETPASLKDWLSMQSVVVDNNADK